MYNIQYALNNKERNNGWDYHCQFAACCGAKVATTKDAFNDTVIGVCIGIFDEPDDALLTQNGHEVHHVVLGEKHVYIKLLKEPLGYIYNQSYEPSSISKTTKLKDNLDLFWTFSLEQFAWGEDFSRNTRHLKPGYYFLISLAHTDYYKNDYRQYLSKIEKNGFTLVKEFDPCWNANYLNDGEYDEEEEESFDNSERLKLHIYKYGDF